MLHDLFQNLVILLGLSLLVTIAFQRLKIPSILGFLATGIIVGPSVLGLITYHDNSVSLPAEIGIIMLMFIIGMEFNIGLIRSLKKEIVIGGLLQLSLTIALVMGALYFTSLPFKQTLFIGFLMALSSTAIVLKVLQERGELNTPHGKIITSILIFQDIAAVPLMLITPTLNSDLGEMWRELGWLALKGAIAVVFVIIASRKVVPWLLFKSNQNAQQRTFFVVDSLHLLHFHLAHLGDWFIGSLGAFLAGIIISDSDYNHQAHTIIHPFREIFTNFFFISIGTLLDVQYLGNNLWIILLSVVLIFIIKLFTGSIATQFLKYPVRTSFLTGLALFQVGEFSFILAEVGLRSNIIDNSIYQTFLSISIITMGITPIFMQHQEKLCKIFVKTKFSQIIHSYLNTESEEFTIPHLKEMKNHIIIIGFGLTGRNIAKAAKDAQIPYVIIEINPDTVRLAQKEGEPIIFGIGTGDSIMEELNVSKARVAVISISDSKIVRQIISNLKNCNPALEIIVKTRKLGEIREFYKLGATEVIPSDLETAVQIFGRVVSKYDFHPSEIKFLTDQIRKKAFQRYEH